MEVQRVTETFCRFPGGVEKGSSPLQVTLLRLTKEQHVTPIPELGEHTVQIADQSTNEERIPINYEEYGITEPVVACTITGLYELGIFRDPKGIITFLESYRNNPNKPQEQTVLGVVQAVFQPIEVSELAERATFVRESFLGRLYRSFATRQVVEQTPNPHSQDLINIDRDIIDFIYLSQAALLKNPTQALDLIDTFIKTYIGIRRVEMGAAFVAYDRFKQHFSYDRFEETATEEADKIKSIVRHILEKFQEKYNTLFGTNVSLPEDKDIQYYLATDISSGMTFLVSYPEYLPSHDRVTEQDPSFLSRRMTHPIQQVGDIRPDDPEKIQKDEGDNLKVLYTWDGQPIPVGTMSACPVFLNSWMKETVFESSREE